MILTKKIKKKPQEINLIKKMRGRNNNQPNQN